MSRHTYTDQDGDQLTIYTRTSAHRDHDDLAFADQSALLLSIKDPHSSHRADERFVFINTHDIPHIMRNLADAYKERTQP